MPGATGSCLLHRRSEFVGWAGFGGPPLVAAPPIGVPFSFTYGGGRRLLLDGAVTDGEAAAVGGEVGRDLLVLGDPRSLLEPDLGLTGRGWRYSDEPPREGQVERDDLLGRVTWRWTDGEDVRWFDEETGVLLRERTGRHDLELLSLTIGPVDPSVFAVAGSPAPQAITHEVLEDEDPGFDVPWWPTGATAYHLAGDPDVPEVLLALPTADAFVTLGIAPAGQQPRVGEGQVRRWSGDGWEFALAWTGDLPDVDEVVASIPRSWS